MSNWTDAHCHLQDEFFENAPDAPALVRRTLERARAAGVDRIVVIGTGEHSSREALALTDLSGDVDVLATVGLHPHDATEDLGPIERLARGAPAPGRYR